MSKTSTREGSGFLELYSQPFPSSRKGALYNAFSYPTKISPEAIALFIATHTQPGAVVVDTFAGSGTTGLATLLCDKPTDEMKALAVDLGLEPTWGPRRAEIYDIGTLGAFVAQTLCAPPDPQNFEKAAKDLLARGQAALPGLYDAQGPDGEPGDLRHAIWSEVVVCPHCAGETPYWDAAVRRNPTLSLEKSFRCPSCGKKCDIEDCERAVELKPDPVLGEMVARRKRILARVYGQSGKTKWQRSPVLEDYRVIEKVEALPFPDKAPKAEIHWGDLYRSGYHTGISHLHHFYTSRNFLVMATLWELVAEYPCELQDALRLLLLSYNSTHSTLMTRVVVKKGETDFVLTGSQSGVLYVSGLPVEKNIFAGVKRKAAQLKQAFVTVHGSRSEVRVVNSSSTSLALPDASVDYVFTDPPFGDYIPYAEVNQLNEIWLGKRTDRDQEIIISNAQQKTVDNYGEMLMDVFSEISRVLKPQGHATVVFHSALPSVWNALVTGYTSAGLHVKACSVLDKLQASFKQTVSTVSVKGDPLLLLSNNEADAPARAVTVEAEKIIADIIGSARMAGDQERNPQRLYSRLIARCLELGVPIPMGAREFYNLVEVEFRKAS